MNEYAVEQLPRRLGRSTDRGPTYTNSKASILSPTDLKPKNECSFETTRVPELSVGQLGYSLKHRAEMDILKSPIEIAQA